MFDVARNNQLKRSLRQRSWSGLAHHSSLQSYFGCLLICHTPEIVGDLFRKGYCVLQHLRNVCCLCFSLTGKFGEQFKSHYQAIVNGISTPWIGIPHGKLLNSSSAAVVARPKACHDVCHANGHVSPGGPA